ncbi:MAG: HAD family hydrolase [Chitinispirillaceae bacterium]|nr:HAD family hydrolase [Chitinispirillaceae bacterium]
MKVRGIIFDLDGTLIDTLEDIAFSMNAALAALGAPPHPVDNYRRFVGQGLEVLATLVLPADRRDNETVQRCVSSMRAVYGRRWAHATRPYPGIIDMLDEVRRRAISMAVLSNKAHDFTVKMVTRFFGSERFQTILGGGKFPFKPDPSGALHIAAVMGCAPAEMLYGGDSDIDMKTACAAGMFPLGVTWGFRSRQELIDHGARILIDAPDELIGALDRFLLC